MNEQLAEVVDIRSIPLENLCISGGQVRLKDVDKGIGDLAQSIKVMGLLEPIVVCQAEKRGKFEILIGQRRYLAHKLLKRKEITAVVLKRRPNETIAKGISLTENFVRRDLTQQELIDACTGLYNKYGSLKTVAEKLGLNSQSVSNYVKFDRLVPELKALVKEGKVNVKTALRAQDASTSAVGILNRDEAVQLAQEMAAMSGAQQRTVAKARKREAELPVHEVLRNARTSAKVTQILVTLSADIHGALRRYAEKRKTNQDLAACALIEQGLRINGEHLNEGTVVENGKHAPA